VICCWKFEAPSFWLSRSEKPGCELPSRPAVASATRACEVWPEVTASAVPPFWSW
jgi:hypothetical protein